ncbi:MAG: YidC/Oxa1 family membrane protein insertase [Clostridia bacterium]|nr:YidC/Oxa1 family membrane protein insertase [Clostridia bacterium]
MFDIFGILGKPLGWVMAQIFNLVGNYFVTIFLFTLIIRLLLFPLSLKQQKSTMERARLAPKQERLQKKYGNDRQKLAQKQQELYEKEGVSMTAGCLPMVLSMIVLFGVIAAIYKPLAYLATPSIPEQVIRVAEQAILVHGTELEYEEAAPAGEGKVTENQLAGYYGELRLMLNSERGSNKEDITREIDEPSPRALARAYSDAGIVSEEKKDGKVTYTVNEQAYQEKLAAYQALTAGKTGAEYYDQIVKMSEQFSLFPGFSLLEQPWNEDGFAGINWLWIIPLLSGLTSLAASFLTMRYSKKSMPQNQPGQGCSQYSMLIFMPAFSTWIAFSVPGAVGVYWIFSNIISLAQTVALNKIYDPAKARAEAEKEYEERRRRKAEDKKRLAQSRQREEAEARQAEQEEERQREESREMSKKKKKKKGAKAPQKVEDTAPQEDDESDLDVDATSDEDEAEDAGESPRENDAADTPTDEE